MERQKVRKNSKSTERTRCRVLGTSAARSVHAFTLTELLLALGILSLLIAALLPVLGSARQSAHRSSCASNMHQCALGLSLYADDYDSFFPSHLVATRGKDLLEWHDHFCRGLTSQGAQVSWVSLTRPYHHGRTQPADTGLMAEFFCPADIDRTPHAGTSYEFKMALSNGMTASSVRSTGSTLLLWEQWGFHTRTKASEYDRRSEMNVIFVDGHTAWLRLSQTTSAQFGDGPDLHWTEAGANVPVEYRNNDVLSN